MTKPTTIVERLRRAHPNSPQYIHGSNLLADAADEIERLQSDSERHITEKEALAANLRRAHAALEKIANGDPSQVYSPLGALHAAGIVCQWEIDAKIAREGLGSPVEPSALADARDQTANVALTCSGACRYTNGEFIADPACKDHGAHQGCAIDGCVKPRVPLAQFCADHLREYRP